MGLDQYCYGIDLNLLENLDGRAFELFNVDKDYYNIINDKRYYMIDEENINDYIDNVASIYDLSDEQVKNIKNVDSYDDLLISEEGNLYTTNCYDIWVGRKNNVVQCFMEDLLDVQNYSPEEINENVINQLEEYLQEQLKHPLVTQAEKILGKNLLDCSYDDLNNKREEIENIDTSEYDILRVLYPIHCLLRNTCELGYIWLEDLIETKGFIDEFKKANNEFDYVFYNCWY